MLTCEEALFAADVAEQYPPNHGDWWGSVPPMKSSGGERDPFGFVQMYPEFEVYG